MSKHPIYIRLINATKWRRLRLRKLHDDPLCENCTKEGRITLATEVHHIVPVESVNTEKEMKVLMYSYTNLMSICHDCHVSIHKEMKSKSKAAIKAAKKRRTDGFIEKYL